MNNKKAVFSTLFCIFIAALFILGCNNHLLKPQQDEPRLLVKIANSTGARNATTTGEWQISAWIENRDGTKSHQQEISTKENNFILTFENIVIGSQINIHLEVTKIDDTQTKFTGESGWITVKEGEQVIEIPLESQTNTDDSGEGNGSTSGGETEGDEPAIVNAETPVITQQPHGKSQTFEPNTATLVTTPLEIAATIGDGGTLTYQWYSNTSNSTSGGTLINGATNKTYTASTEAKTTTYFYCVVTNTNNSVNGIKTASATSNIATVASIEGELSSITARYTGTHELVNSEINYSNVEIQQTYTAGSETQVVTVSAEEVQDQYTIELQYNNAIGNVPATVTHTETKKQTTVTIPVKYQLDENNLTLNGSKSVEQNGTLSLTAKYADASGSDITYQKYDGGSTSTDYKVKEMISVSWSGATATEGNSWEATADTTTAGSKSATVTITSTDKDWCVTTDSISKSHNFEVIALGAQSNPVTTWEQLTSAIASTTNPIYVDTNSMEATSTIEITGTTEIIPLQSLTIERTSTFTSKFFDVKTGGNLTLGDGSNTITLDGKGIDASDPLVFTSGNLTLDKVLLTNNKNTNSPTFNTTLFIYSGTTTLNNVSFSGNTSSQDGAADIWLYQSSTQSSLIIGQNFAATEIYFSGSSTSYPRITLTAESSITASAGKPSITVGVTSNSTPKGIITKNGFTGNIADFFTLANEGYILDENGSVVAAPIEITDENSLVQAIADAQAGAVLTIAQDITITNTIAVNKKIVIDGSSGGKLLRTGEAITTPMFDVNSSGNLTLQNITLDGQNSDEGQDNPFIFNEGTVTLQSSTLQNNIMYAVDLYKQISLNGGAIYSTGTLTIADSTIQNIKANAQDAATVSIAGGSITIYNSTIQISLSATNSASLDSLYLASGIQYRFTSTGDFTTNSSSSFINVDTDITKETTSLESTPQSNVPENGLSWDASTTTLTIYNETGLINFRKIVNGDVSPSAPITVGDKTFSGQDRSVKATLANDIALTSSEDWTPIGKSGSYSGYAGTFDGAGCTVSGVKISSGTNKGFFGQIESQAKITGLTVAGNISASTYTGGIVGTAAGGTIQYCVNNVQVTSTSDYVGGIVGYVYGGTPSITGCVNLAQITGNNYIGGIIGHSSSSYAATIDKCINLGSVNSSNTNLSYVGGIQGYSSASSNKITNSLNLGTINNSKGNGAGIICNDTSLTIQYCLSAGTISASSKYAIASNTSGSYTGNYYDSSKITGATTTGGTGKTTSALKVASASSLDSSWSTNWSFASGRYPLPNIQDNIPPTIWNNNIVTKASE